MGTVSTNGKASAKRTATKNGNLTKLQASCLRLIGGVAPYGYSFTQDDIFGAEGIYGLRHSRYDAEREFFTRWFSVRNRGAWIVNLFDGLVRKGYVVPSGVTKKDRAEAKTKSRNPDDILTAQIWRDKLDAEQRDKDPRFTISMLGRPCVEAAGTNGSAALDRQCA